MPSSDESRSLICLHEQLIESVTQLSSTAIRGVSNWSAPRTEVTVATDIQWVQKTAGNIVSKRRVSKLKKPKVEKCEPLVYIDVEEEEEEVTMSQYSEYSEYSDPMTGDTHYTSSLGQENLPVPTGAIDEQELECKYCPKTFRSQSSMTEHMARHEGRDRYWCKVCKKGFQQKAHHEGHMNAHMNYKPYECPFCKKTFSYSQSLRTHQTHGKCSFPGGNDDQYQQI